MLDGKIQPFMILDGKDGFTIKVLRSVIESVPGWHYNQTIVLPGTATGTVSGHACIGNDVEPIKEALAPFKIVFQVAWG
eukprot:1914327-Prymnesium_polylepis.1